MSLNRRERQATSSELRANLDLSGQTPDDLAHALGRSAAEIQGVFDLADVAPADVWLVRDALDRAVRATGATPAPWSVLTDQARTAAQQWFVLADVDDVLARGAR